MSKITIKNDINTELTIAHRNGSKAKTLYTDELAKAVATIDDMVNIDTPNDGDVCIVKDMDRGGTFIYDATSGITTTDDGTKFYGWVRQYTKLFLDYFINNTSNVADSLESASKVGDIYLKDKEYNLTSLAVITNSCSIIGSGNSTFLLGTNGHIKFWNNTTSASFIKGIVCKDFIIKGIDNTADGITTYLTASCTFDNIKFEKLNKCFIQKRTSTTLITNCGNTNIEDGNLDSNYFVWADDTLAERSNDNIYSFNKVRTINETLFLGSKIAGGSQDGANVHDNIFFANKSGSLIYIDNARWSTIENNKLFLSAKHGIELNGPIHVSINNNILAWCGRKTVAGNVPNGIYVYSGAGGYTTTYGDVNISDNQIVQPIGNGIKISRVRSGNISNNVIANPSDPSHDISGDSAVGEGKFDGINADNLFEFTISNNSITRTRDGASGNSKGKTWNLDINIDSISTYNRIEHNQVSKNTKFIDGEMNYPLTIANDGTATVKLKNKTVAITTDESIGAIEFDVNDTSGLGAGIKGSISVKSLDSTGYSYYMSFATTSGDDVNNREVAILDHIGRFFPAIDSFGSLGIPTKRWKDVFLDIPIADPHVVGQLWNNSGVVTVSAG